MRGKTLPLIGTNSNSQGWLYQDSMSIKVALIRFYDELETKIYRSTVYTCKATSLMKILEIYASVDRLNEIRTLEAQFRYKKCVSTCFREYLALTDRSSL